MSTSDPLFRPIDATRQNFWGLTSFSLWSTDGALCGIKNYRQVPSKGLFPLELIPIAFDFSLAGIVFFLVALLLFIPFAIIVALTAGNKQRNTQDLLQTLDPTSTEYLTWDSKNFRLPLSHIARAEFFAPATHRFSPPPIQNLRLHLHSGQLWHFTMTERADADQLQSIFERANIPTTRGEEKSLAQKLVQILSFPLGTT